MTNVRALAAQTLFLVVDKGQSLSQLIPTKTAPLTPQDKALFQQICYGVLRYLPSLEHYCQTLLDQPLKGKNRVFQFLLYVGIYQLQHMRTPEHAAVAETVNALKPMKAPGLKGLVNAILRNFLRQRAELERAADEIPACRYNHPGWFIKKLQHAYPQTWQDILSANQQQAPMWLRVNRRRHGRDEYSSLLEQAGIGHSLNPAFRDGIKLDKPCDVNTLPGFKDGTCSVQDAAAQLAGALLEAQNGERILDACAAPGGKTCHILETAAVEMTALDADETRLQRVQQNLDRLGFNAHLLCADASSNAWFDGNAFDRILLDVPCSATGVIRRHPDIKWLRRASDIDELVKLQSAILDNIWPMLKPGGTLVYATCSVLPDENAQQIAAFLARHSDAVHQPLNEHDTPDNPGWQFLPGESDGFYYAKLMKR